MRVLHVVGKMHRGGVETWLMHLLRGCDCRIKFDFLVHTDMACEYDDEIRSLGARLIPCVHPRINPFGYTHNLWRILQSEGPYDVVHCHLREFSGWVLTVASWAGVPVRVAHCHNDLVRYYRRNLYGRIRCLAMIRLVDRHATLGLAASQEAAASLYGASWRRDPRWRVLHCGVDLTPFRGDQTHRTVVRSELGIPTDAFVVGHVGRFVRQKNHNLLIEIAAELVRRAPGFRLLLVGEGELRPEIEAKVADLGLSRWVIFAGSRADVPRLMRGAMDVFVLPSWWEGLPLVGIEAQAAGLPLLISDCLTLELDIVPDLVRRISLAAAASTWAEAILAARDGKTQVAQHKSFQQVFDSEFNITRCTSEVLALYDSLEGRPICRA
ncbi:Glycosyltransferase involved in cell wall bisynthesis [Singulisphaera sp. GP187]|uniref:glycosyltransferase n=1 Tax=Singulisphaera sp. GP187 TaxID=1882752 RepID=UPI00092AAA1A|nr:glycosyltransferase [Singulisphaera sp. GP187]SIO09786.1 Glycosyltransferase involved in cell wall bisynthesis [Singulisphaera sp. GP187]